jgi:Zn-finger nucleic acid-binding protein
MNCRNCAAAMELFDRRRYYFCRYCGTFEFLDAPGTDGVQVLERHADALPCPLCSTPLAKSLLDHAHVIQHCERCRGVLLERAIFAYAIANRRSHAAGPGQPGELDRREFERRITCPTCRTQMDVHPYYGPGNVIIDTCRKCDLVWLDFGELQQISNAPGDDRGRPRADREPRSEPSAQLSDDEDGARAGGFTVGASVMDVFVKLFGA